MDNMCEKMEIGVEYVEDGRLRDKLGSTAYDLSTSLTHFSINVVPVVCLKSGLNNMP